MRTYPHFFSGVFIKCFPVTIGGGSVGKYYETPLTDKITFNESTDEATLVTWVKFDNHLKTYQWLVSQPSVNTYGSGRAALLLRVFGGTAGFSISNTTANSGSISATDSSGTITQNNTWYMLAGRMNTTHISIFVNGEEKGSTARTMNPHTSGDWKK